MNNQLSYPHGDTTGRHIGGFHIRRMPAADAGLVMPAAASSLPIMHIEPIQSVQNRHNTVPLSAGKQTLVRVYLDTSALPDGVQLRGELGIRTASGGGEVFVPSMDSITTGPSQNAKVQYRRHDFSGSLNFLLPASVASGKKLLRVSRLEGPDGVPLKVEDLAFKLAFVRCAPLRVRAVGLQYKDQGKLYTPTADDFASLRSFLIRAYPSAKVEWSHLVVDADFTPPFNQMTPVRANAQLAAIRSRDVSAGIDRRTHYYGLVSDGQGQHFMRGLANAIPGTPSPHAVACGPAGLEQLPNGPSPYTGWYGAHELGHTFGRYHPGFPPLYFPDGQRNPRGQDDSDDTFPYADGSLTRGDDEFVAFDAGDPAVKNAEMRIMRGSECFDVMTYLDNLWVSAYTLEAIRLRLNDENKLGA
ncbi:MAG: hypothetical protein JSR28_15795 [Proteobacteria bacterium]|nr:hypothetical protein [Pseudomonadota bacterium]